MNSPWKPAILKMKPFGPEMDKDVPVESRSGGGYYTINLHRYTCTCPDFVLRRAGLPVGDIGRSCKHLRDAVLALDSDSFGDELTRVIFKSPYGPYDRIWFAPGPDGEIIALALSEDKPWINLFLRNSSDGHYERYGFNPKESRWSWDSQPPDAENVLHLVSLIPGGLAR